MSSNNSIQPNRIKELRLKKKLTQKDLANEFNQYIANKNINIRPVSYATISRWESGESQPKEEALVVLSGFFNVDIAYLHGYSKDNSGKAEYIADLLEKAKFSDDEEMNIRIKSTLEDTFYDVYEELGYLQNQIDELKNPYSDYDPS